MKVCVVLVATCIALGFAQIPKKCTSPPTWEARVVDVEYTEDRGNVGKYFYDADNQRTAFFVTEYVDGEEITSRQIYDLHKENSRYDYDVMEEKCIKTDLPPNSFRPVNISSTARFVDTVIIGTNADLRYGVAINLWEDYTQFGRVIMEFVADDGDGDENCYPVSMTEASERGVRHQSFFDIVAGVNPSHFIPPQECYEN